MLTQFPLNAGWQLKILDPVYSLEDNLAHPGGWMPAQVPGTVYQTLLEQGRIPDPYYGRQELDVQWVAQHDWIYQLDFVIPDEWGQYPHLDLVFEGLDTVVQIWLDGQFLDYHTSMFVPLRLDMRSLLAPGSHQLVLIFSSALSEGKALEEQYGKRPLWNGDSSRLYLRKAQYQYGWDWGPTLLTSGPWKAIYLEGYTSRLTEVHVATQFPTGLERAILRLRLRMQNPQPDQQIELLLLDPQGEVVHQTLFPALAFQQHPLVVDAPQLWWPHTLGSQPLYRLVVRLLQGDQELHRLEQRLGIRDLQVIQEPVDQEAGTSFYFAVNGVPFFAGGANWIPEDLLPNRITPGQYRERLEQAVQANMNMLRVWGGGLYEPDLFYDLCDELGLLVWQDFMFACGIYPAHSEFVQLVQQEAEAAVARLRHHACLALWCGNNEDYTLAESVGLAGPNQPPQALESRQIYERVLPEIVQRMDPGRFYWPGSPSGGAHSQDPTVGDRHTWDVWHGPMHPYQSYGQFEGRFVSEFGLQSYPALSTLEAALPPDQRFPQSATVVHHNKAGSVGQPDGHRRLAVYLADNLRDPVTLQGYVYATQFVQAEAMKYAYSQFRRRWGQPGSRAVGGALVWQLNDCWPAISWAIIDSAGRPKPAYYTIARELAPFSIGAQTTEGQVQVWVTNGLLQPVEAEWEVVVFTLGGQLLIQHRQPVWLPANQVTELEPLPLPTATVPLVVAARVWMAELVLARTACWPEPYKYHTFADPGLEVVRRGPNQLVITVERPTKGLVIEADQPLVLSDNFLDLMPDEPQIIEWQGETPAALTLRWYGEAPYPSLRVELGE